MDFQDLSALRNLGPRSRAMLEAAGITTHADLRARGAVDAYVSMKQAGLPVTLNLLWALDGALADRDWRHVARTERFRLLTELELRGVQP